MEKFPIIIHVPHSSIFIPPEIRKDILLSDDELESELLGMTDWYTDEFAAMGEKSESGLALREGSTGT